MSARARTLAIAAAALALAVAIAGVGEGRRLPGAPACPVFPRTSHWNKPVDKLPVVSGSDAIVGGIGRDRGAHADFGSGTLRGSADRNPVQGRDQAPAQGARQLRVCGRVRSRALPDPPQRPGRGRPRLRRRPARDRDRPLALPPLRALCRLPRCRRSAGAPARARSGTCARTSCGRAAGPRPTRPGCRSSPASPATTRPSAAASTTRCASPSRGRAPPTSTRRATRPRTRATRACRRWASGCGSSAASMCRASRARRA